MMKELFPGIYRVDPSKITATKYVSYFVVSKHGNLLFPCFSNGGNIRSSIDEINKLGSISMQLLGDMHHKARYADELYTLTNAYTYCSDIEEPSVKKSIKYLKSFPFERHFIRPDLEVIPTPGHRPGSCSYLLTLNRKKFLFIGDLIWNDSGKWAALPNKSGKNDMIKSLKLLSEVSFNQLFFTAQVSNEICSLKLTAKERKLFFNKLISDIN